MKASSIMFNALFLILCYMNPDGAMGRSSGLESVADSNALLFKELKGKIIDAITRCDETSLEIVEFILKSCKDSTWCKVKVLMEETAALITAVQVKDQGSPQVRAKMAQLLLKNGADQAWIDFILIREAEAAKAADLIAGELIREANEAEAAKAKAEPKKLQKQKKQKGKRFRNPKKNTKNQESIKKAVEETKEELWLSMEKNNGQGLSEAARSLRLIADRIDALVDGQVEAPIIQMDWNVGDGEYLYNYQLDHQYQLDRMNVPDPGYPGDAFGNFDMHGSFYYYRWSVIDGALYQYEHPRCGFYDTFGTFHFYQNPYRQAYHQAYAGEHVENESHQEVPLALFSDVQEDHGHEEIKKLTALST